MNYISQEEVKRAIREAFKELPLRVEINTIINSMPTVDLIMCGECIYKSETDGYGPYCNFWHDITGDADFCSYGERRTDEHTD